MEYVQLNDGNKIPAIGFGVFMIPNDGPTGGIHFPCPYLALLSIMNGAVSISFR